MKNNDTVSVLKDIIRINTQVDGGNSMGFTKYLENILNYYGLNYNVYSSCKEKQNIIVTIPGHSNETIFINGHFDTKPHGDLNKWRYNPFDPVEDDIKIWGLGSSDMKGGIASMISLIHYIGQNIITPRYNLEFHFVDDEENNSGFGLKYLLKQRLINGNGSLAIICEPTENSLVINSLGNTWKIIKIKGKSAHAGHYFEGINANEKLVEILLNVKKKVDTLKGSDKIFPQFPNINIGIIRGGAHPGTVPAESEAVIDIRVYKEEDKDKIVSLIYDEAKISNAQVVLEDYLPGMIPFRYNDYKTAFSEKILLEIGKQYNQLTSELIKTDYFLGGSDAGDYVREFKMAACVFGPGSLKQAHMPNEWIAKNLLIQHNEVLKRVLC